MGEWFLALALLFLAIGHVLLIKKCASLESEIPNHTNGLKSMMAEVRDLLDEALDMIQQLAPSIPDLAPTQAASESLPNLILNTLLARMGMPEPDASTTQPQEWEVLQPNDTPPQNEI